MKYYLKCFYALFLIAIPIFLFVLPADFFDHGESLCLSQQLFQKECLACGMTRATQNLIHLQFERAIHYNKLSLIVIPVLITIWFLEMRKLKKYFFKRD